MAECGGECCTLQRQADHSLLSLVLYLIAMSCTESARSEEHGGYLVRSQGQPAQDSVAKLKRAAFAKGHIFDHYDDDRIVENAAIF